MSSTAARLAALRRLKGRKSRGGFESDSDDDENANESSEEETFEVEPHSRNDDFVVDDDGLGYAEEGYNSDEIDRQYNEVSNKRGKGKKPSAATATAAAKRKQANMRNQRSAPRPNYKQSSTLRSRASIRAKQGSTPAKPGADAATDKGKQGSLNTFFARANVAPQASSMQGRMAANKTGGARSMGGAASRRLAARSNKVPTKEEQNKFMANILADMSSDEDGNDMDMGMDSGIPPPPVTTIPPAPMDFVQDENVSHMNQSNSNDIGAPPLKRARHSRQQTGRVTTLKSDPKDLEKDIQHLNTGLQSMDIDESRHKSTPPKSSSPTAATTANTASTAAAATSQSVNPAPIVGSMPDPMADDGTELDFTALEQESTPTNGHISNIDTVEDTSNFPAHKDGFINVYWLDCHENPFNKPGCLYLFGKTLDPKEKQWKSVCVLVKNIQRSMYVLPRLANPADSSDETRLEIMDVYKEIEQVRRALGVHKWKCQPINMKYCFRDRSQGVPTETQYMKVKYGFEHDPIDPERPGHTYSHVFNTRASALEIFLLEKQIMGPCWLQIPVCSPPKKISWSRVEVLVEDPTQVTKLSTNYPSPKLKVCSIAMQTTLNKKKEHEIACLALSLHSHCNVGSDTKAMNGEDYFAIIRKIDRNPFPFDLDKHLSNRKFDVKKLRKVSLERELLTFFITKLHEWDPDVIVGHKLFDFMMDVILHRMEKAKIGVQWSKIGRLRVGKFPFINGRLMRKSVGPGRLLCDTFLSAQEFIHEKTYSLSHLVETQLNVRNHKNYDASRMTEWWMDAKPLAEIVTHCVNDSNLVLKLMLKLQILPLTKELTCLCGNLWQRSLTSQRAERNEFLLLHEFYREGYIAPEKYTKKEKIHKGIIIDANPTNKRRKKAQYSGGLVLEPVRGLYDKMVLCMDFNSLYPSIMQEYNLCFTTVKHYLPQKESQSNEVDTEALRPSDDLATGILPNVIGVLLSRRKAVKAALKKTEKEDLKKSLDIQQKALKLVANSMYGCLGFDNSRFYCKPIASLITALGREALSNAAQIATSVDSSLRVIYGDTDSIMVYTGLADLKGARTMGREIKKKINGTYRKMYLELDDVYAKMLLLRKKKYAALKVVDSQLDTKTNTLTFNTSPEIKGLDLVRRDWAIISKEVGQKVLDVILSDKSVEDVVSGVHLVLNEVKAASDANTIALDRYIITKKLTKNPTQYPDADKQPHVQVAIRMQKIGIPVNVGDFIPYIICTRFRDGKMAATHNSSKGGIAQRAYHIQEIIKSQKSSVENERLVADRQWYLETQILPPVSRYCDPIEGTDMGQLANALGLESSKFQHLSRGGGNGGNNGDYDDDESEQKLLALSDPRQKYTQCKPLKIVCPYCRASYNFMGVFNFADGSCGLQCAATDCKGLVSLDDTDLKHRDMSRLKNNISQHLQHFMSQYYNRRWLCSDPTCQFSTRTLPIKGALCCKVGCNHRLVESYTAEQLFNQIRYYAYLFDTAMARKVLTIEQKKNKQLMDGMAPLQKQALDEIRHYIQTQFLDKSKYYFIDSNVLFQFLC